MSSVPVLLCCTSLSSVSSSYNIHHHLQDNCIRITNPSQNDTDEDGVGDACDNCQYASNPQQWNLDNDNNGDVCDNDDDNDGVGTYVNLESL